MTIPRLAAAGRFDPERLFRPGSVATVASVAETEGLTAPPDLAVIAAPAADVGAIMAALAAKGCFAATVPGPADNLAEAARRTGVRALGPNAFGLAVPGLKVDSSQSHIPVPAGRLALVSQSIGLTRAVIDWAGPNGVGFSHIVGIGDNADVGFGMTLDWLASDSTTGAILLEIGHIKDRRAFLSAARAASRYRPVVAFRSAPPDPDGTAALVFEAALRRAGVLTVAGLEDMLAAAETLSRARPARGEGLAILAADPGAANLAATAAARHGLDVVPRDAAGGVLVVLTPGEDLAPDFAPHRDAVPVLVCAMGETTGAPLRRTLAAAGWPVFASPNQAVLGFLHMVRDRRNRAAARELPESAMLPLAPDQDAVRRIFGAGRTGQESAAVLAAYGVPATLETTIAVFDDAVFGPAIALGPERAMDLPPLNLTLARVLAERAHVPGMAETLVRISQLIVDFPEIASLSAGAGTTPSIALRAPEAPASRLAIAPYPSEWVEQWDTGGHHLTIRPIRPEDAEAHGAFFHRLSPTDVRFRFFSAIHELTPERMARLTQVDYEREMAFVAIRETTGETVGVARLVSDTEGRVGEFAIIVQTDMKGLGLASHLMRRLIAWARQRGLTEVVGQILSDNAPMLAFVRRLEFTLHRLPDDPEVLEARLALS